MFIARKTIKEFFVLPILQANLEEFRRIEQEHPNSIKLVYGCEDQLLAVKTFQVDEVMGDVYNEEYYGVIGDYLIEDPEGVFYVMTHVEFEAGYEIVREA